MYTPPLPSMRFWLNDVLNIGTLQQYTPWATLSTDLMDAVLNEAGTMASTLLAPLNQTGDREGARHHKGEVTMPKGFKEAYSQWIQAGWNGMTAPALYGGQDLPKVLATAINELWHSANMAFALCPMLTQSAITLLTHHASSQLRDTYLPPLVKGLWTGTMCMTEPHAGSDVGAVRTEAIPSGEHYRLKGEKIFITYGEHDLAENILHLVLARTPGAQAGTKGLSLFLVPKWLQAPNGSWTTRNDVFCRSLEHKLGIHASPTAVMQFGAGEGAVGYLVGAIGEGLRAMFTMMNQARLSVGLEGLAIAERAFQDALRYTNERVQGKVLGMDGLWPIFQHPDVQRTLLTMRSQIEAMRGLSYWTAMAMDRASKHQAPTKAHPYQWWVDMCIPVVKAQGSEMGFTLSSLAMQLFGGMGYVEESGMPQYLRDSRIAMIYEGTNAIQALDLLGRKLSQNQGEAWRAMAEVMQAWGNTAMEVAPASFKPAIGLWQEAFTHWVNTTTYLSDMWQRAPRDAAFHATPYLRLFGLVVMGGMWLQALSALKQRKSNDPFSQEMQQLAGFYLMQMLPEVWSLAMQINTSSFWYPAR